MYVCVCMIIFAVAWASICEEVFVDVLLADEGFQRAEEELLRRL